MKNMSEHIQHTMEYNSSRNILIMPEYGRNIQLLVEYAKKIEDKEYRYAFAEKILDLMNQMHPQNRNIEDYRAKLWKHLYQIANFELDVIPPDGVIPTRDEVYKKPDRVPYPHSDARYRHYGNNVQQMIKKALSMEPGPKRQGFIAVIGSYMKLAYRTWNKDLYVSDEIIKNDLHSLSDGALKIEDHTSLDNLSGSSSSNNSRRRPSNNNRRNSGSKSNYSRGGSNSGGRNKYKGRK